jgi:porin
VSWDGFLPGREYDRFGLLVAAALAGEDFRRALLGQDKQIAGHETALELTYRLQLTDWLTLQPDLQYVINSGLDPELEDALVVGLRFELVLGKQW